ncbi:hypothetical protein N431DRAFT_494881 [Stipitochalara longipes BDJ]|nr:hypothetical protein N431DRAFT_494881 [Stipitochalara longipes BDJ]
MVIGEGLLLPYFQNLPTEVQLQIWECALPEPCIVHLSNHGTNNLKRTEELYEPFSSRQPESPLRSICRDSRLVFNRKYVQLDRITNLEHDRPVFFDQKLDTLYLDVTCDILYHPTINRLNNAAIEPADEERSSHFLFLASQETLKSIQHLAIEYKSWNRFCFEHKITLMGDFFPCFPALETCSFVFRDLCICADGEEFKYPLEMEDTKEGTVVWLYEEIAMLAESTAFEKIRKEHPAFIIPEFDIKILKKGKQESMGALFNTDRQGHSWISSD